MVALLNPNPPLSAPLPSENILDGGLYLPKRSFDRWTMGAKPPRTFLTAALNNTDTTSTVNVAPVPSNASAVAALRPVPFPIIIDSEQMLVTSIGTGLNWTATRAVNTTAKAAHAGPVAPGLQGAAVLLDAVTHIVGVGDSTLQGTVGSNDEFLQRIARMLGRTMGGASGLMGRGFRGLWLSGNSAAIGGGAGNSLAEWSAPGGSWSLVTAGGTTDRAPWGWAVTATGATNILQWTAPANLTTAAIDIWTVSTTLQQPSYSLDGTTWTNVTLQPADVGNLVYFRVPTALPNGFIQIRAANAAGVNTSPVIAGITHWSVAPTFGQTQGIIVHNLGRDAAFLSTWARANASGSTFAIFDSDNGSMLPDLVMLGPFTNDVGAFGAAAVAGVITNLTTFINRVFPYADVLVLNYMEQGGGRDPIAQAAQRNQTKALCQSLGVGCLDLYDAMGAEGTFGFSACQAAGLFFDNLHASQLGNNDIGARITRGLGYTTI